MIHSLSGGIVSEDIRADFVKVEIEGEGSFWYVSKIADLKEGDFVVVPFGRNAKEVKAKGLRIDKNVSYQISPIPFKHAKTILRKI